MTESVRDIRPPRQRRSQDAFARVLQAGRTILEDEGLQGFTVQAVSRLSGVSVGSIYRRAPSREALLLAIHDEETARMARDETWLRDIVKDDSPHRQIEFIVTKTARLILENSRILRAFMRQGVNDAEVWERGQAASRELSGHFERAILLHRSVLVHPDPVVAANFSFRMVYSLTSRRVTHGEKFESLESLSDETFVNELARAVVSYLLPPRATT